MTSSSKYLTLSPRPGCLSTGLSGDPRQGGGVDGVGHSEGLHHPAGTCSLGPGGNDLGGQSDTDGNWIIMRVFCNQFHLGEVT